MHQSVKYSHNTGCHRNSGWKVPSRYEDVVVSSIFFIWGSCERRSVYYRILFFFLMVFISLHKISHFGHNFKYGWNNTLLCVFVFCFFNIGDDFIVSTKVFSSLTIHSTYTLQCSSFIYRMVKDRKFPVAHITSCPWFGNVGGDFGFTGISWIGLP